MASTCKRCGNTDLSHFAPHALKTKRMLCKACMKAKRLQHRGNMTDNMTRRMLFNLKQKCRYQKRPEGALWSLEDVERLYKQFQMQETGDSAKERGSGYVRLRIVPVEKDKPMTVDNAKIIPFGVGVGVR